MRIKGEGCFDTGAFHGTIWIRRDRRRELEVDSEHDVDISYGRHCMLDRTDFWGRRCLLDKPLTDITHTCGVMNVVDLCTRLTLSIEHGW